MLSFLLFSDQISEGEFLRGGGANCLRGMPCRWENARSWLHKVTPSFHMFVNLLRTCCDAIVLVVGYFCFIWKPLHDKFTTMPHDSYNGCPKKRPTFDLM